MREWGQRCCMVDELGEFKRHLRVIELLFVLLDTIGLIIGFALKLCPGRLAPSVLVCEMT